MSHRLSKVPSWAHLMFLAVGALLGVLLYAFSVPTVSAQSADNFCAAGEVPQFRFGFAAYRQQMGTTVGEAVECEHYDEQGNAYQKTTTGLLFYNKSTGQVTFTPDATNNTPSSDNFCTAGEQPQFRFGFAALARQLGAAVGEPVECEHYDEEGNAYQKTTTGDLYYDKSSGRTSFTPNGSDVSTQPAPAASNESPPPANCSLAGTISQTEGPYYTANPPFRTSLIEPGMAGTRLILTGQVLDTDCQPVAGALLDFWHADANGNYDNSGYRLRGKLYADAQGYYRLETVVPGLYPGRTRHIHVKVSRPGGRILTTQLYFNGEPRNQSDRIFNSSLAMTLSNASDGSQQATFDFVLAR